MIFDDLFHQRQTDPATGAPYGLKFPVITIADMVRAQAMLIEDLGIETLFAAVGGSMGGMQVLQWAASYPERVFAAMPIACATRHSAQNIAFHEVGRQAIMADPDWCQGNYADEGKIPKRGGDGAAQPARPARPAPAAALGAAEERLGHAIEAFGWQRLEPAQQTAAIGVAAEAGDFYVAKQGRINQSFVTWNFRPLTIPELAKLAAGAALAAAATFAQTPAGPPVDPDLITSPDDWWSERRGAAHEAIRQGKPELAYEMVRDAGPLTVSRHLSREARTMDRG